MAASAEERILDKAGSKTTGKSAQEPPAQPPMNCPECASHHIWKDGFRYVKAETGELPIQRYLCRTCGRRFSESAEPKVTVHVPTQPLKTSNPRKNDLEKGIIGANLSFKEGLNGSSLLVGEDVASHDVSVITTVEKRLNSLPCYNSKRQVCVSESRTKNLSRQRIRQKRAAGATNTLDIKGLLLEYAWSLKKQGYADSTIRSDVSCVRTLWKRRADLYNPDSVKLVIARQDWSNNRKRNVINAYDLFARMKGLEWEKPKCHCTRKIPFIPHEEELDTLISGCGPKTSAFLQLLKETAMRAGEAKSLEWIDIDVQKRLVTLNNPEKGSNPRMWKVSNKLINMLNQLPRNSEKVFGDSLVSSTRTTYNKSRKRLAEKLSNLRLLNISFHTFRHWKATMLYHKTKDPYYVKNFLGHKSLKSTERYITIEQSIFESSSDEFIVRVTEKPKEIKELLEVGFEYVCQKDDLTFLRKLK